MKNTSRDAYYERLKTLAQVSNVQSGTPKHTLGNLIDYKRAANGVAYGIIKENHNYYIKKGGVSENLNESDFAYIGGLANITSFQYKSLSEADKNRGMLLSTINEASNLNLGMATEDIADDEIGNAEAKLDNLETATAAELSPDDEMAAGLEAEPNGGEEATPELPVDTGDSEELPADDSEELPADGIDVDTLDVGGDDTGEELPADDSEELPVDDGGENIDADELSDDPLKEIEKSLGKITNKIRNAEIEPAQIKSFVNSFLSAFKDKFPEIEIEDRKEMANKILKVVPPEDVEGLGADVENTEELDLGENGCSECGSFATYVESMGYDSAQSLMECGEEEVTNLVSGYANANAEGSNDGDHENVALVIKLVNPEILNTLKNDYGHEEYANAVTPYVDQMNEALESDSMEKLEELFGGLRNLGKAAKSGINKAANAVGNKVGQAANAVADKTSQGFNAAKDAVGQVATNVKDTVGQAATNISQTYHSGEVAGEVQKLEKAANQLGQQVQALNTRLQKAGKEPINTGSIIATLTNQIKKSGGQANIGGSKLGASLAEINDPATIETQPMMEDDEVGFATDSQPLGGGVVKPDGAPTTGVDINVSPDKSINISMNETIQKISEGLDELTTGLSNKARKQAYNDNADNIIKGSIRRNQYNTFSNYINPEIGKYFGNLGIGVEPEGDNVLLNVKGSGGNNVYITVSRDKYSVDGSVDNIDPSLQRKLKIGIEKLQQDLKQPDTSNELEENLPINEAETKLRKYVRKRLTEKVKGIKPTLNENTKSAKLKKLDEMIDKQFESYISKKKI